VNLCWVSVLIIEICLWVTWQPISTLSVGPNERGVDSNMIILLTPSFRDLWVTSNHESEWGPGFHGYDKVWLVSDVTTRLSLVTVWPHKRLGGSVRESCVYPMMWGPWLGLRVWITRRFVWLSGFFGYITWICEWCHRGLWWPGIHGDWVTPVSVVTDFHLFRQTFVCDLTTQCFLR